MLRFITAGNVDNGKSTMIGRLLYDNGSIPADILESIGQPGREADLSLITDGLRSERENKITIDVAYKYFSTAKRKFIIADTPGHFEYTGNMFTGASTAQLAVILVDVRQGAMEQTRRHASIISLMRMPAVIFCINKMDLVAYSEERFNEAKNTLQKLFFPQGTAIHYIPVSAARGDNIVRLSEHMRWYEGKSLLHHLEEAPVESNENDLPARAQVQLLLTNGLQRGVAAKIRSGFFRKGEKIIALPSENEYEISGIEAAGKKSELAMSGQSVTIYLSNSGTIKRGDILVKAGSSPLITSEIEATLCWMNAETLHKNSRWILQHCSRAISVQVTDITAKVNPGSSEFEKSDGKMYMHEMARVKLACTEPLVFDLHRENRAMGGFILSDERTGSTVGAGIF